MTLQSYSFQVIHKAGKDNTADCFSRLLQTLPNHLNEDNEVDHHVNMVTTNSIPRSLSLELVRNESKLDPELMAVRNALNTNNWSSSHCQYYKDIQHELTEDDFILLKGT